ncbi:MAG: triose-phosphate isomerase [Proteobacteria bacterium]|nr:triose-phosphate isomerase [Pseudomonadota bacterium]
MKPLFVANWKMHGSLAFIRDWTAAIAAPSKQCQVAVCPPFPYLATMRAALSNDFLIGAQTIAAPRDAGAHTGEVSGTMLADIGCDLVLVGHSERRNAQHENDALCADKIRAAVAAGLQPILCVGETDCVREQGGSAAAINTVLAQINAALGDADAKILQKIIIAYEPIWAIGSGKTPTIDDIQQLHSAIRATLIEQTAAFGGKITLLYGGSVNADNAQEFMNIENVNGFLVGGASLKPQTFNTICNSFSPL